MTGELACLHLGRNNLRKITCHLHGVGDIWSCAFCLTQAAAVSLILILFHSLCHCSFSGRLQCVPSDSCRFQRGNDSYVTPGGKQGSQRLLGMTLYGPSLASARLKYLLSIPLHGFLTNGQICSETRTFWSRHFRL